VLHAAAEAQCGETLRARERVEATVPRLFVRCDAEVAPGLRRMEPLDAEAEKAIDMLIGCVSKRIEQIQ
jgi:hypothetical protein